MRTVSRHDEVNAVQLLKILKYAHAVSVGGA
jgi:hypothetical protein